MIFNLWKCAVKRLMIMKLFIHLLFNDFFNATIPQSACNQRIIRYLFNNNNLKMLELLWRHALLMQHVDALFILLFLLNMK